MVAVPAARRLRAQFVSPNGDMKPRRPPYSQMVTGVVLGKPVFRPRTVIRTSGPMGTPNASSGFAIALKKGTHRGTRRRSVDPPPPGSALIWILAGVFELFGAPEGRADLEWPAGALNDPVSIGSFRAASEAAQGRPRRDDLESGDLDVVEV